MNNKRRLIFLILLGLTVAAVAGLIFYLSSQSMTASQKSGKMILEWILHLIKPDLNQLSPQAYTRMINIAQYRYRKIAHFLEFAALGLLLCWLFQALRWRCPRLLAWTATALYAISDEWHQSFQKTRTASWRDVGIDCAGALAGVLICYAVTRLLIKAKARKKASAPSPPE